MQPQQYYDQLVRSGAAGAVFGDVRRGKALAMVLEQVKISDSAGKPITLEELRQATQDEHDHNH
jgi:trigger factor